MGQARTIPRPFLTGALLVAVALLLGVALTGGDSPEELTGLVVAVDGDLTDVRSFDVLAGGEQTRFTPAPDGDFDFPLGHLRDHLRTGEPVTVGYEQRDGGLMAVRIRDAG